MLGYASSPRWRSAVSAAVPCVVVASALWPAPWTQSVVSNGFNNSSNTAITALAVFTTNVSTYLYAATANHVEGARLYRSTDGAYWTTIGDTGLLGSSNSAVRTLMVAEHAIHGMALYLATSNEASGAELWRSTDTFYWIRCGAPGFGNPRNTAIRALATHNGWLFTGTENHSEGAEIWKSSDAVTWIPVMTGGFGHPATTAVLCFAITPTAHLLAGTRNTTSGGGLWISSDAAVWARAADPGFGNPANAEISALAVFKDTVLAGTRNDTGGAEIWYSTDTVTWARASVPRHPAARAVTCFFGCDNAQPNVHPGAVPGGADAGSVSQTYYPFHDQLPASFPGGFIYAGLAGGGTQVVRSADGASWGFPVSEIFGSTGNTAVCAIAAFNGLLYFATENNATGGQIHRGRLYRISGTVADGAGNRVNGVQVTLTGLEHRTTVTRYRYTAPWRYDPGVFRIDNLLPGLYTLTPALTGYFFSPESRQIGLYFDIESIPFTVSGMYPRFSISGTVRDVHGSPVPNVLITLDEGAWFVRTGEDGAYSFVQLDEGWHTVTPFLSSVTAFTPPRREYPHLSHAQVHQDFIVHGGTPPPTYRITGTVRDRFHRGIPNVTLHLAGMSSGSCTTDGSGQFAFEQLLLGGYLLTPRKEGYTFIPESRSYLPLLRDADGQTFYEAITPTLDDVVCAPNPARADRGDTVVVFANLPDRVTIRVYTLAGALVRTIEKDNQVPSCTWDLCNSVRKPVATGLYLYTITDGSGRSRSGRIAVIR